jgi:hypothetical protein
MGDCYVHKAFNVNFKSLDAKARHSRQLHNGVLVVWKGMI